MIFIISYMWVYFEIDRNYFVHCPFQFNIYNLWSWYSVITKYIKSESLDIPYSKEHLLAGNVIH
jgi:hypothetical protein